MSESSVAELWSQMSSSYLAGDFDLAERVGGELIRQEPRHVRALHCLSVISNRKNKKDHEFHLLRAVLEIDPTHVQALIGLANIIRAKGETEKAIDLCQRAIYRLPSYANAHNTLGLCRMSQNRPLEAAKCFSIALAYQPGLTAAQQNLISALGRVKDREKALVPSTHEDFENLAWLLVFQRKRSEAIEMFKRGLALAPNSPRLLQALADQLRQYGDAKESIPIWRRLISINPDAYHLYSGLGYAYQDLGKFQDALGAFDRSLALNPNQGDAYLGKVTSRKIVADDAAMIEEMRGLSPGLSALERVFLHTALSKCEDDLANYEAAVRQMDEANRVAQMESGLYQPFEAQWYSRLFQSNATTFDRKFFESAPPPASLSERPVFVVGLPRSGTTLIEQMLSRHPQIAAAGEVPYWSDQESILAGGLGNAIDDRALRERVVFEYLEILKRVDPDASRVLDKMPDNFAHIGFIHAMIPNARFIHCQRNALDNCVSIYMTPFRNRPPMAYRREDILAYFRGYQQMSRHWRGVIPEDRLLDLNYEDVVADSENALRRVVEFLGLEWDSACLDQGKYEGSVNTPSNWQTRQPIYSTSVERWRRYEPWLGPFRELI